jgi:serine/threonine protein kinase
MTPERWREVTQIYGAVVSQAPERRAAAVAELCGADVELRREIESLLQSKDGVSLLERAAVDRGSVMQMLSVGSQIGVFRIDSLLGVGGMGEVYRARDTKLNRDVAIKILPPAFANDPDRLARFKREAQVLASLNHPNIATIHGFEDSSGVHALVLELVEGPTLADRIQRGRLEVSEAIAIAKQIAEALEAAHEQGIIHRDLKPANVKVRDDGTVKVLDFGLAKIAEPAGVVQAFRPASPGGPEGPHYASQSPTITTPAMTAAGMILGTAAYMSPEQAKGRPADKRSDIWAFGCVLYEMLAGKRAFDGEDVSDTLANVLKTDPDWSVLPVNTPRSLRRLLGRALQKDRRRRFADIADARFEMEESGDADQVIEQPPAPRLLRWRERAIWAGVAAIAVAAALVLSTRSSAPGSSREVQFDIQTGVTTEMESIAMSPDGTRIVFVDMLNNQRRLSLRAFDSLTSRALEHTDGAQNPFWSPDGRSVAFFSGGQLKKIDLDSGSVQTITEAPRGLGGSWNRDGVILFAPTAGGLFRVNDSGGASIPVTVPRNAGAKHVSPQFLPDGRHFIYYIDDEKNESGEYVGELNSKESKRIVSDIDGAAWFVRGDYLMFPRRAALLAQRFDLNQLKPVEDIVQVAESIRVDTPRRLTAVTSSSEGSFAYRARSLIAQGDRLAWFDRAGRELERLDSVEPADTNNFGLSPKGDSVALGRGGRVGGGIWLLETTRRVISSLGRPGNFPIFSPDGTRIAYSASKTTSNLDLFVATVSGGTDDIPLLVTRQSKQPTDWSFDNKFLAYRTSDPQTGYDVWVLPLEGDRTPLPIAHTAADEREGQFSPDAGWIAYESSESGRPEIYVQPFGRIGDREKISTNGGTQPRWRRDGQELFYVALDGELMAVAVTSSSATDRQLPLGAQTRLFPSHVVIGGPPGVQYVPSIDGQRFLINVMRERAAEPINVVLHWKGLAVNNTVASSQQ